MAKKNPYKHTFNVVVELDGADMFNIQDPDFIVGVVKGLQGKMKESYFHCKKPEKLFIYMLATDDMENVYKMTSGESKTED